MVPGVSPLKAIRVLAKVNEREPINVSNIMKMVGEGRMKMFPAGPESVIFACKGYSGLAHIVAAGGVLRDLLDTLPAVERFFAFRGAVALSIDGRKGWERVLKAHGYAREGELLVKELGHG